MFLLPYAAPYDALLYALFGLDLALLIGGLAFGRPAADGSGRLPLGVRMSLSAILVVAALAQWRLAAGSPVGAYGGWVCLGMALGFLGDLIMANLIRVPDRLVFGMLVFGLGHIAYLAALVGLAHTLQLWSGPLYLGVWALLVAIGVGLWYSLVQKPGGDRVQNAGALVYSLLMASMNALAIGLALGSERFIPLAVGAVLFLTSDLVLGNWNIRGHHWKGVNDVVWVTYNLGQLLIVYSVASAVHLA